MYKLKKINLSNNLTSIPSNAFQNCTSLTSIDIPAGVTGIGVSAFHGSTSLTSINIPAGVTIIGASAFYNCTSLTTITYEGTVEQWNAITFTGSWNYNVPATEVVCSNGTVTL